MKRNRARIGDRYAALFASRGPSCDFECVVELRKHGASIADENAPRIGQLDATRLAAEQLRIDFALDGSDLAAERGRLHAKPLRGAGEVLLLRDGEDIAKLP
jgi:hypothetical protein